MVLVLRPNVANVMAASVQRRARASSFASPSTSSDDGWVPSSSRSLAQRARARRVVLRRCDRASSERAAPARAVAGEGTAAKPAESVEAAPPAETEEEEVPAKKEIDPSDPEYKSLEVMRKFSEQYARRTKTFFCSDPGVTAVVIKGLADHKDQLGAPLCPCRHYEDKEAEVAQGFWNCPCVPMRERRECHCMLFLTEDNAFAAEDAKITLDELADLTDGF